MHASTAAPDTAGWRALQPSLVSQGLLTAEPLAKAHALLKQKWGNAFQVQQQQKQLASAHPNAPTSSGSPGETHHALQEHDSYPEPENTRLKVCSLDASPALAECAECC